MMLLKKWTLNIAVLFLLQFC